MSAPAAPVVIDGKLYDPCAKPDCERLVPGTVRHCCTACAVAAQYRNEIDEHSEGCDDRWAERRPYAQAQAAAGQ